MSLNINIPYPIVVLHRLGPSDGMSNDSGERNNINKEL